MNCDNCQKDFDIFKEGYSHEFFAVCKKCWAVERERREIGGVFTREVN